jgi:GMP synthase (glutamine-hydrolysing)
VRELNTYCEIHPYDVPPSFIAEFAPAGIILSGGPESVTAGDTPRAPAPVWTAGKPVLGICYGMQTMAAQLGGEVQNGLTREFGYAAVRARGHGRLLDGIQDRSGTDGQGLLDVWMSHGDKVISLPPGFTLMASNEATPIAGMMDNRAASTACSSTRKSHIPSKARPSCSASCATFADARRLDDAGLRRRGDREIDASR